MTIRFRRKHLFGIAAKRYGQKSYGERFLAVRAIAASKFKTNCGSL